MLARRWAVLITDNYHPSALGAFFASIIPVGLPPVLSDLIRPVAGRSAAGEQAAKRSAESIDWTGIGPDRPKLATAGPQVRCDRGEDGGTGSTSNPYPHLRLQSTLVVTASSAPISLAGICQKAGGIQHFA